MALIYSQITSLDGYVDDENGNFDWSMPTAEVHQFINDRERRISTQIYGRRLYETMAVWETMPLDDEPDVIRDYAQIWRGADKIVVSSTLASVSSERTTLVRDFDASLIAARGDTSIGGPTLAARAFRAGLIDEVCQFASPVIVGAGTRFLPDGLKLDLELVDEHRFDNGVVFLRYLTRR